MMARLLHRYNDSERLNHWVVAILFVCAGLSGLALFHPSLFFLGNFFGGGPWTRILHPFLGVLMTLSFLGLLVRFWRHNLGEESDKAWSDNMGKLLRGDKSGMPAVGRYNPGQKRVFWLMAVSLLVLVATGITFWRPWFAPYFSIELMRIAVVLHAIAAVVLVLTTTVHIYAAIWVKGTMRAMTRGTVSESWARRNHALWYQEMKQGK
jgi:formate dehydrogenase subunit gamma